MYYIIPQLISGCVSVCIKESHFPTKATRAVDRCAAQRDSGRHVSSNELSAQLLASHPAFALFVSASRRSLNGSFVPFLKVPRDTTGVGPERVTRAFQATMRQASEEYHPTSSQAVVQLPSLLFQPHPCRKLFAFLSS